eukprot:TRINITY_DN5586_c0_g1_i4.p1 TRINITY_DN5586_c0_g1~~TRINITY_DN5586_c0_g1_i4.p1  ORF type:complete len:377 (-),score=32.86 TRINITY_DN5586_c0_g1_i4:317-1447(-)
MPELRDWQIYGIVFFCFGLPFTLLAMVLQHTRRNTPMLSERSYIFLLLQHLGVVFTIVIDSVEMISRDLSVRKTCDAQIWPAFISFPAFGLPIMMRCWIYCYRFYATKARRRSLVGGRVLGGSFLFQPRYIYPFFIVTYFLQLLIPAILTSIRNDNESIYCSPVGQSLAPLVILLVAFYLALITVTIILLWPSKDAYFIKGEMRCILFIWLPIIIVWGLSFLGTIPRVIPNTVYIMFAMILSTAVSGYYVYKRAGDDNKITCVSSRDNLTNLLGNQKFKEKFTDFLELQLCVENIQFWDEVQVYKATPSEGQAEAARAISAKYIEPCSPYEVNISGHARSSVVQCINDSSISFDIFALVSPVRSMEGGHEHEGLAA